MTRDYEFTPDDDTRPENSSPPAPASPLLLIGAPAGPDPRLSIAHLLVGMACVAFYLGVLQWLIAQLSSGAANRTFTMLRTESEGIVQALWLTALVLWAVRRYQGRPFPRYPGEVLWIALGVQASLLPIVFAFKVFCQHFQFERQSFFIVFIALLLGPYLVAALLFRRGARRTTVRRWRFFLNFSAITCVLTAVVMLIAIVRGQIPLNSWLSTYAIKILHWSPRILLLVPWIIYLAVVAGDLKSRTRCPGTHWAPAIIMPLDLSSYLFQTLLLFMYRGR
jgi:hypothetical protein